MSAESIEEIFVEYANDKGPVPMHRALEKAFDRGKMCGGEADAICRWLRSQPVDRFTTYDSLAADIERGAHR